MVGPFAKSVRMLVSHTLRTNYVILLVLWLTLLMWQPRVMLTWRLKLFLCVSLHVLGAGDIIYLVVSSCLRSKMLTWQLLTCTSLIALHTVGMLTGKLCMGTLPSLLMWN